MATARLLTHLFLSYYTHLNLFLQVMISLPDGQNWKLLKEREGLLLKLERVHYSLHKRAAGMKWSRLIEAAKVISGAEYLQNQFRLLVTFKTHVSHVYDTRVFRPRMAWRRKGVVIDLPTGRLMSPMPWLRNGPLSRNWRRISTALCSTVTLTKWMPPPS